MHCSLEIHLERKKFQYLKNFTLSLTRIMSITDVQLGGQGEDLPCPVLKMKKKSALILEKKALIASNLMLNLLFKMSSREYLKEKTAKHFLEGAFFSGIFDEMFIGVP